MVTQNIQDCDIKFLIATHYTNSVKNDWLIFKINDFILLNFLFFIFSECKMGILPIQKEPELIQV